MSRRPSKSRAVSSPSSYDRSYNPVVRQIHPSQHSQQQYEGFFKGLGVSSREPTSSKRNTAIKQLHWASHFAMGCQKWDEGARGPSTQHAEFTDPGVTFATRDAPYKNASVVELRQTAYDGDIHFRTEQRENFADHGNLAKRRPCSPGPTQVHLGDDRPEKITQTAACHFRAPDEESRRMAQFRHAGSGVLIPTSVWPKPLRCNPVTGGKRHLDLHDMGMHEGGFSRYTSNHSAIVPDVEVMRNPVHGFYVPTEALTVPGAKTTADIVADANKAIPPLRSGGAIRPHLHPDRMDRLGLQTGSDFGPRVAVTAPWDREQY